MEKKIIILAGNREQFERFLDDNGLTDSEAVYGYDSRAILSTHARDIHVTGTFWDRKDAGELIRLAESRIF